MGLRQLKELDIRDTEVTDAGLGCLNGLSQLQELNLYGSKMTYKGVKKLKQALPKCEIDTEEVLRRNGVF